MSTSPHTSAEAAGIDMSRVEQARWFAEEVRPQELELRNWLRRRFPWLTDIDDLVQETYIRLVRAKRQGRIKHAKAYLFTTARNAALDQARRNRIAPIESVAEMESLGVLEGERDAIATITHREKLEILANAIESLPERCRLVVKLRKLQGLPYEEIAQRLGVSVHTVNAQLVKGMTLCRDYLRRHGLTNDEA